MRIAGLCLSASGFNNIRAWVDRSGHELALLITIPTTANDLIMQIANVDPGTAVFVAPNVPACGPVLASHDCDLGIVASFRIIDAATAAIPRHGMVNLHSSLLPAFAGPNGFRELYSGASEIGATLHWLVDEVDGGAILAQAAVSVPDDIQPADAAELMAAAAATVLDEGVPRALAGAAGAPQTGAQHPVASLFDQSERRLEPELSRQMFQAQFCALALAGVQPSVAIAGEWKPVRSVFRINGVTANRSGIVHHVGRRALLAVADGLLELELGPLAIT